MDLCLIGYWRNDQHPELPDPRDLIDSSWDRSDRNVVVQYFRLGTHARAFMGLSPCRICGALNGAGEYTDGRFLWPEGFVHYIERHDLKPPQAVVDWALAQMEEIETAEVDRDWWLRATS